MGAYVAGVASSPFGKQPELNFRSLADSVVRDVVADAGLKNGQTIQHIALWQLRYGCMGSSQYSRSGCPNAPAHASQWLAAHVPIINVEGGCATGSLAFQSAYHAVLSGCDLALAVGVEKTWFAHEPARSFDLFSGGIDQLHQHEWLDFYGEAGRMSGHGFEPHPKRVIF